MFHHAVVDVPLAVNAVSFKSTEERARDNYDHTSQKRRTLPGIVQELTDLIDVRGPIFNYKRVITTTTTVDIGPIRLY